MPSLSWNGDQPGARPIAIVRGPKSGPNYGRLLYAIEDQFAGGAAPARADKPSKPADPLQDYMHGGGSKDVSNMQEIKLTHPHEIFEPLCAPSDKPETREVYWVFGAGGSGKSWMCRALAQNYLKAHDGSRRVILISALPQDSTLDALGSSLVRLDPANFIAKGIPSLESFEKCLVIMDDLPTSGPEMKACLELQDMIVERGRHTSTSLIRTSHVASDYSNTRKILNSADFVVVYPSGGGQGHALRYLLQTHVGLESKQIQDLKHVKSRWVLFRKTNPVYQLSAVDCKITE